MRSFLGIIIALFISIPAAAQAGGIQRDTPAAKPELQIFVDTAGVAAIGDSIYLTWVFAKATEHGLPSSGILVGFDCRQHMVKRFAHVVYKLNGDSTGVTGPVIQDDQSWVGVSLPLLFNMVCGIGPKHGDAKIAPPTAPKETPKSPYSKV